MERRERQWTLADPSYFNTSTVHTPNTKRGEGVKKPLRTPTERELVGKRKSEREEGDRERVGVLKGPCSETSQA